MRMTLERLDTKFSFGRLMMTNLNRLIEADRDALISHTQELIKINSVESEAKQGMPFGEGVHEALTYVLKLAADIGLDTINADGYAGHADLGESEDIIAVLVHLDVVPEGKGWDYPPFGGEIHNGKIYGRGIIDDKGPAIASLYALKALKDSGKQLKKKIRIIFGTDEESGWKDLDYYFEHYPRPAVGFSPDAEFPLIHGEKGIQIITLTTELNQDQAPVIIQKLSGGNAPNMVPDHCQAILHAEETIKSPINDILSRYAEKTGYHISIEEDLDTLVIDSYGVSAHGSMPEKGQNAISQMMGFLNRCPGLSESAAKLMKSYVQLLDMEYNGKSFGCGFEDELSGKMIMNVGLVSLVDRTVSFTVNTRYPITTEGRTVIDSMQDKLSGTGISLHLIEDIKPLYVPKNNELVETLLRVYQEESGDYTSVPVTIGGGTYARALTQGVAFGPLFPGQEELAHQKNEAMAVDDLIRITKIYAKAMEVLAT
jgi:succinyl-diaminopimelate desuccinylase